MTLRRALVRYAERYIGNFYSWGGESPDSFDCSGFASECAKAVGIFPRKSRPTADSLMSYGRSHGWAAVSVASPGCFVFWINGSGRAFHVEIAVDPPWFSIGASGGGPHVITKEDAAEANAFIKQRPIGRGGTVVILDPWPASA